MPNTSSTNHTQLPARADLIRLGVGVLGIGTSGSLIATSIMPVPTLIFWRNLGGALVTAPFALRQSQWRNRHGLLWSSLAGVLLALHFMGFFLAMRMTSVASGTALAALQPIFAALFLKISGSHIPSKVWLGMVVSFSGVLLISGIDLHLSVRSFLGDLSGLGSAAFAALYLMAGAKAQVNFETTTYTTICYFICSLTVLPIALFSSLPVMHFPAREWWIVGGLILGAQILGHTLFNSTLRRVSPAVISLIVFFEVPVSALIAFLWLDQKPAFGVLPGIVLVLVGCVLVVTRTRPNDVEVVL